jgi:hypothetical protein
MIDRRSVLKGGGAAAMGMLAITAIESGTTPAAAATTGPFFSGDPAQTGEALPFPKHLTHDERQHLETFDELDFVVYSNQEWGRLGESHAPDIRVHWPDGHHTDGLAQHIEDLKWQFIWAPDTRAVAHPVRVAKGNLTAVTGVVTGTFSRPMPGAQGGTTPPTGKRFAMNMVTVGLWNQRGTMDEEFIFLDQMTLFHQIGLA